MAGLRQRLVQAENAARARERELEKLGRALEEARKGEWQASSQVRRMQHTGDGTCDQWAHASSCSPPAWRHYSAACMVFGCPEVACVQAVMASPCHGMLCTGGGQ